MAKRTFAFVAVFTVLLSVTLSVQAENYDYYWSGSSDSYYLTTGNWNVGSPSGQQATVGLNTSGNNITAYMYNTNGVITLHNNNLGTSVYSVNIGTENGTGSASLFYDHNSTYYDFYIENGKTLSVYDGGTFTFAGAKRFVNNGTVNLNSGANFIVTEAELVIIDGANSVLNIKNGSTLTVTPTTYIGTANNGATVNQTGGDATFNGRLALGWGDHSGYYNLSGGTLTTTGEAGLWGANGSGISEFTVSGGTANFNKTGNSFEIGLGGSNALANKFTLQGTGIVNVAETFAVKNSGILNIEGGTFNAPTITVDSASTFNMTGGALKTTAINMNGGTFTQGGGSLVYNGKLTVNGDVVLTSGTIDLSNYHAAYNQTVDVIEASNGISAVSYTVKGDGWTTNIVGNKLTATYTGGSDNYYWTGTTSNDYYTGTNWSINGARYSGAELDSRPPTFSKNCFILTSSGSVNLDWSTLGVACLTVGNGVGGTTGTAVVSRTGNIDVQTNLLVNKGGTVTASGAITVTSRNETPGTLTVDGGTFNANSTTEVSGNLVVNDGTYNANGATTINNGGTLTVNGGTFNANNTTNVAGTLNVQSGDYNATGATTVNANGSLTIDGGTFTFNASGVQLKNNGTITISDDGALTVSSDSNSFRIGDRGIGVLNVNGGSLTVNAPTYLGVGNANDTQTSGTINQTAGTVTFNSKICFGWGEWPGAYNLSGGTLTTTAAAGLWNDNANGVSTFNVTGGQANFNTFVIGLSETSAKNYALANVFNLNSGEVNTTGTFTVRKTGILNVAKNGETGGDGVFNANTLDITTDGVLNLSSGTINLGSGGITNSTAASPKDYNINLSGGTFGTNIASWSTSLDATISSNAVTFAPAEGKTIAWNGTLDGSGGVTKTGDGTLTLSGDNAYTGATTVEAGELVFSGSTLPKSAITATGGTLVLGTTGNAIAAQDGSSITANGGDVRVDGNLNISSGTVTVKGDWTGNGAINVNNDGEMHVATSFSHTNEIKLNGGTLRNPTAGQNAVIASTVNVISDSYIQASDKKYTALDGVLKGSGNITIPSDTGSVNFSGDASQYTGSLYVNGIIRIGKNYEDVLDSASFIGSNPITLDGGEIQTNGYNLNVTNDLILNSESYFQARYGKNMTLTGSITGDGTFHVHSSNAKNQNGWVIAETTCTDNSFTGDVWTDNDSNPYGWLKIGADNAFGTNAGTAIVWGTLDLSGHKQTFAGLYNNGNTSKGTVDSSQPGGVLTLKLNEGNSKSFGNIVRGQLSLVLTGDGTGTQTLVEAPLYTGSTTIKAGTLKLNAGGTLYNLSGGSLDASGHTDVAGHLISTGNLTLTNSELSKFIGSISAPAIVKDGNGTLQIYGEAEGSIDVQSLTVSSGRLDLKGYMTGGITVDAGGVFSPGNSVGEATFGGGYILKEGATLLIEQDATGIDKLNVKSFTFQEDSVSQSIDLDITGIPFGAEYEIIKSTNPFTGNMINEDYWLSHFSSELPEYMTLAIRNGDTVVLMIDRNAVPEPSTWALLILGAAGMLYWRKRKNNK
ncbi:MAG: autotransporter-associated beta strand repeat-containing protein [Thermoguttaceae bacterium]|nr:autotransporter-associated beta strand repeat-containing protein [Thermoguttaceae bacterium]